MKLVSVVGVPKPLEAVFSMAEVEREEDRDYSFSRCVPFSFRLPSLPFFASFHPTFCYSGMPGSLLTFLPREHWQSGPENQQRGKDWLGQIYRHNDNQTAEMMAAHKDFRMSFPLLLLPTLPFPPILIRRGEKLIRNAPSQVGSPLKSPTASTFPTTPSSTASTRSSSSFRAS